MAGNDDYQLTGFLLSPALHCTAPLHLVWVEEVLVRCGGGGLVGGPGPGHLIPINYPQ